MNDRHLWRGAVLVAGLAIAGAALYLSPLRATLQPAGLIRTARAYGDAWWLPPAYFAAYALLDILFIPTQALSVAAVFAWGWLRGGIIELLAATTGAIFPFLIARSALRPALASRLKRHRSVARILEREGFMLLLLLRVIPIIPYTILNYVAGLSSLKLRPYALATLIGMIPSTFIFAYFVDAIVAGAIEPRHVVLRALGAGALFVILIVATRLLAPRVRKRVESRDRGASPTEDGGRG